MRKPRLQELKKLSQLSWDPTPVPSDFRNHTTKRVCQPLVPVLGKIWEKMEV
jgi:hypothetical protein